MPRSLAGVLPESQAGASVTVDDAGGSHTEVAVSNGSHAVAGFTLVIGENCTDAWTYVKVEAAGYQPYREDGVLIYAGLDRQIRIGVKADPGRPGDTLLKALTPVQSGSPNALKGRLATTATGRLRDASGLRRGLFTSDFPALHLWDTDRQEILDSNHKIAMAGWQGVRVFFRLADDGGIPPTPDKFWYGRHVSHDMARRNLLPYLDDLASLGLKVGLTKGCQWRSDAEEQDEAAEIANLIARGGHAETVAWWEILGNEANINHKYGRRGKEVPNPDYNPSDPESHPTQTDYSEAVAYAQPMARMVKNTLGCLTSMGSFTEAGNVLVDISTGVDLVDVHHDRSMPNGIKHIHTVADFCHYKGATPTKGILQGENGGLNDPYPFGSQCGNLSTAINDHDFVFTLTAVEQLTNQLSVHLSGPAIRHFCAIDSCWGFNELPQLMQAVPEDVGGWEGRSFFVKGSEFVWAGLTEWDQMQHPPFTITNWTATSAHGVASGTTIEALRQAMTAKGYIVRGTFA